MIWNDSGWFWDDSWDGCYNLTFHKILIWTYVDEVTKQLTVEASELVMGEERAAVELKDKIHFLS